MAGRGSTAAQQALSERDVAAVREEVSAGRTVTVWFTAAAVGVAAGGSAKVVAVGDAAEGDFIQVRPAGSRDALFCSPSELTRTRPARRSAAGEGAASAAATEPAAKSATGPRPQTGGTRADATPATAPEQATRSAKPTPAAKQASGATPAAGETSAAPEAPARPARARRPTRATAPSTPAPELSEAPAKAERVAPGRGRRRGERSGALTVSLTSTAGGDWTVEVLVGAKRVVQATPVQAADVAAASRSLPPAVAEVVTSALAEARRRQEERVALLREELDAAQRTLEQLGVD